MADEKYRAAETVCLSLERRIIMSVLGLSCNYWHLIHCCMEWAIKIWEQSCAASQRCTPTRADQRSRGFSTSSSRICSSPTSETVGESFHSEKRTNATETIRWRITIKSWMAKLELERQPITGVIFTFNNLVAVRKMAQTTTRRMATSTKSGKSGEYSLFLIHQFFLRESCTFVVFL